MKNFIYSEDYTKLGFDGHIACSCITGSRHPINIYEKFINFWFGNGIKIWYFIA
jgi:hypothetical protein